MITHKLLDTKGGWISSLGAAHHNLQRSYNDEQNMSKITNENYNQESKQHSLGQSRQYSQ